MKAVTMVLAVAFAASATPAHGQTTTTNGTRLTLGDSSSLSLEGTSTLHGFTCRTHSIQAVVEVDPMLLTAPLKTVAHPMERVEVTIPVTSLTCGEGGKMDNNMYNTLKAKEFATITYTLETYTVDSVAVAADSLVAHTKGNLTISGSTQPVMMDVRISRDANGVTHASGSMALKMSDFKIKPPTFFLGTLRVGDRVVINFDLAANRAVAVGLNHQ